MNEEVLSSQILGKRFFRVPQREVEPMTFQNTGWNALTTEGTRGERAPFSFTISLTKSFTPKKHTGRTGQNLNHITIVLLEHYLWEAR